MQGQRSNSLLGVDALREPPYDVTILFTTNPTWQNQNRSTVLEILKKQDLRINLESKWPVGLSL